MDPVPPPSTKHFLRENGWFLWLTKAARSLAARLRSRTLQQRLHTTGLRIGPHAHIAGLAHMRLGRNIATGSGLWLEAITWFAGEAFSPLLTLGDDCNLSNNVHIACTNRVTIGSGLLSGSNVLISDHGHGLYRGPRQTSPAMRPATRPLSRDGVVVIGNNVWLGDGVIVLAGADIGDGCILGANSLVRHALPPRTLCVGSPAVPIRAWDEASQSWQPIPPARS